MACLVQHLLGCLSAYDRKSLESSPLHVVRHKFGVKQANLNEYTRLVPIQLLMEQSAATDAHDGYDGHFYRLVGWWYLWQHPVFLVRVLFLTRAVRRLTREPPVCV
jgi:hypothetical protein